MNENPYDLMRDAVAKAREINHAADRSANALADILDGRLRHVSRWRLEKLKRQLRDFNITTGRWKGDQ